MNLVSVYDDNYFSRNDYDMLAPGQRKYVVNFLKERQHWQKSGKVLVHEKLEQRVVFNNSPSMGVNPVNELMRIYNEDDIFVVTPLTYSIFLFEKKVEVDVAGLLQRLKELIEVCPFNLLQMKDLTVREPYAELTAFCASELKSFQAEIIETRFKRKRSLR